MAWMNELKRHFQKLLTSRQRAPAIRGTATAPDSLDDRFPDRIGAAGQPVGARVRPATVDMTVPGPAAKGMDASYRQNPPAQPPAGRGAPVAEERACGHAGAAPASDRHGHAPNGRQMVPSWFFPRNLAPRPVEGDPDPAGEPLAARRSTAGTRP